MFTGIVEELGSIASVEGQRVRIAASLVTEDAKAGDSIAVLDCVRQNGGRLLAVTPVHTSLEDYFFDTFGTEKVPELEEKA